MVKEKKVFEHLFASLPLIPKKKQSKTEDEIIERKGGKMGLLGGGEEKRY